MDRTCSIDGCDQPAKTRGWCVKHYMRWLRHGDPLADLRDRKNRHELSPDGHCVLTMIARDASESVVLYDAADAELVRARRWHLNDSGYAITFTIDSDESPTRHPIRMHRVILGLAFDDGLTVDHINGSRLDNRRANLRIVTNAVNSANREIVNGNGSSRYRGVSYDRSRGLWAAYAKVQYRKRYIGRFATEGEAAAAVATFRVENGLPAGW